VHHAGIVFKMSELLFPAETTVMIQFALASVIASQTVFVEGSQIPQKLMFIILTLFNFAYSIASKIS
jgi:hypothetical protein